jgi:hypothetical protein
MVTERGGMHAINNRLSGIILVQFEVSLLCRRLQSFTGWEPLLLEPLRDLIVFSDEA